MIEPATGIKAHRLLENFVPTIPDPYQDEAYRLWAIKQRAGRERPVRPKSRRRTQVAF
jgi:hypothetical protein